MIHRRPTLGRGLADLLGARATAPVAAAPVGDQLAKLPLDLLQRLVISPCSISALLFTAGGPVVLCMNSLGTLNELALS